jgi:hypothetical protein
VDDSAVDVGEVPRESAQLFVQGVPEVSEIDLDFVAPPRVGVLLEEGRLVCAGRGGRAEGNLPSRLPVFVPLALPAVVGDAR